MKNEMGGEEKEGRMRRRRRRDKKKGEVQKEKEEEEKGVTSHEALNEDGSRVSASLTAVGKERERERKKYIHHTQDKYARLKEKGTLKI